MQIIDLIYDADISSHCKIHLFEEKSEEKNKRAFVHKQNITFLIDHFLLYSFSDNH